ncbi:hypothetical protein FRC06_007408 [Ceratobasidium sp. 370]|nr:hypothetical protein FRC06_007408 [Ceratobasidium sp. 370]
MDGTEAESESSEEIERLRRVVLGTCKRGVPSIDGAEAEIEGSDESERLRRVALEAGMRRASLIDGTEAEIEATEESEGLWSETVEIDPMDETESLRYNELLSSGVFCVNSCGGDTSENEETVSTELNEVLRCNVEEAGARATGCSSPGGSTSATKGATNGERSSNSASNEGLAIQSSPLLESKIVIGAGEGKVMEIGRGGTVGRVVVGGRETDSIGEAPQPWGYRLEPHLGLGFPHVGRSP